MIEKIRNNPRLKQFVIGLISPHRHPRPRLWAVSYTHLDVYKRQHVTLRNALIGFGMPDDGSFDTPRDTPYAHGAAMMVRREVPRKAGPMPDIYFLYYEELDWSVRIREQGWKIACGPRCTVSVSYTHLP